MKRLVNLVQLIIVIAIIYPVYYIWDTGRVDELCQQVKPGMSQEGLLKLADQYNLRVEGPENIDPLGGQWRITIPARSSLSGYACVVKGAAKTVAYAEIVSD